MTQSVQRSFRYRFYPTPGQAEQLNRAFGCVRSVHNKALEERARARRSGRPTTYRDSSAALTAWKRTAVGVDAGIAALAVLSTEEKVGNPRHEEAERRRMTAAQRALSRKEPGSANHHKARQRLARIHAKVADRRRDFLHKLTTGLVRDNQTVVIEDLNCSGMMRNHRLARVISDAAWSETRSMLQYKCAWYGRELVVIDRWFPSSKRCSSCGAVRESLPLGVRTWTCPCGANHDRDVNAARNILAAGLAER